MGTKAIIKLICHCFCGINRIKLNNPPMGTETVNQAFPFALNLDQRVKLKIPLRGRFLCQKLI